MLAILYSITLTRVHMMYCILTHTSVPTCPPLTAPDNGTIDCSLGADGVATRGDKCFLNCNDGFILCGSAVRKCWTWRRRIAWTGEDTVCTEGTAPIL